MDENTMATRMENISSRTTRYLGPPGFLIVKSH